MRRQSLSLERGSSIRHPEPAWFRDAKFGVSADPGIFPDPDADGIVSFLEESGVRYLVLPPLGPRGPDAGGRDALLEWKAAASRHGLRFGFETGIGRRASGPAGETLKETEDGSFTEAASRKWLKRTIESIDRSRADLLSLVRVQANGTLNVWERRAAAYLRSANPDSAFCAEFPESGPERGGSADIVDIEKGQSETLRPYLWQAKAAFAEERLPSGRAPGMAARVVIHNLCDIVSKNGNLLLGIGLDADGGLPCGARSALEETGRWLAVNGEAIYGTRPWKSYGEGPTAIYDGPMMQNDGPLTAQDIRFTRKGDVLYALVLGWPEDRLVVIKSLTPGVPLWFGPPARVELVGVDQSPAWGYGPDGLTVILPDQRPCAHAYALRIRGQSTDSMRSAYP